MIKEKEKSKDAPIKKTKTVTKKTTKKDQSGSEDKDKESNEKPKDVVKKTDKKDQSKENEDKEKEKNEKPKEKESKESKERKRFIEAGVFEADGKILFKILKIDLKIIYSLIFLSECSNERRVKIKP